MILLIQHTDLALLSKQVRCSDNQIFRSPYTSLEAYGKLLLQATLPWEEAPSVTAAFLGQCPSITAGDLIQQE